MNQEKSFEFTLGICWSKTPAPTVQSSTMQVSQRKFTDAVPFYINYAPLVDSLNESTFYYARAFCASKYGIVYSNQIYFGTTTPVNPITFSVQSVGHTTVGCTVYLQGIDYSTVKSTGVCLSQNPMPTTSDTKIEVPYGTYSNPFDVDNLNPNTTYYLRAYITTSSKTIYGTQQKVVRTFKGTVTDINGNLYNTVEIGGLEWMTSNLRVSSYNNGNNIPLVANYNQWVNSVNNQIPVYCYYQDNSSYNTTYGKLYPRYVAHHPNLPPLGWHVATVDEWQQLLSIVNVMDLCMDNGSWTQPTTTNPYAFSMYPAGYWDSGYQGGGYRSRFWAVPGISSDNSVHFDSPSSYNVTWSSNGCGFSIRCVKD